MSRWRRAARRAVVVLLAFLFAAPVMANAADATPGSIAADDTGGAPPDDVSDAPASELPPIVVDAGKQGDAALPERSFETPDDVAAFGETIFAEPTWRSFQSPAELLGQSVGAQLRRQGGRDDFATLSIRGAPSGQLRILLDGVPLGRASDSVVNLADLPFDTVERIEVYRGFAPVGLLPSSAAGVVNVITRDPDHATASAAVGGGSFGSAKVNAGGAGPLAGGNASAFAAYRTTDGDFEFKDEGAVNNPNDDEVRKRRNNHSDAIDSLLRWRRDVGSARLQLRNQVFYKDEGVPGFAAAFRSHTQLETVREIGAIALGGADGRWNIEQSANWQRQRLSDTDFRAFDNTAETTTSTTAGKWGRPVGKTHWFAGSAEYSWEGFDQNGATDQDATRSSLAIAAGDDWTVASLHTTVTFQLRHQQLWNSFDSSIRGAGSHDSDHSTDPHAGVRWEPVAGLAIKSNVSSYFRPPTFGELYGNTGFTVGNPGLQPESGIAWDAGFEWTGEREPLGKLAIGYAYFGSNIDDVILVKLTFDRTAKAFNEQNAHIRGHELRAEWHGPAGFALSANYTFQDAENRSDGEFVHGKDLAGLAPHEGWARVSWSHGPFVLAYDIDVTGKHYLDSENIDSISTRTVQGVSVVYGPFWKGLRLTVEADNITDSLVPDQIGFPLPGRAFYATLSWSAAPGQLPAEDVHHAQHSNDAH